MFRKRAENYNASVEFINNPPPGVRITQIAPPANIAIGRTTKNEASLRAAYEAGIDYGNKFIVETQISKAKRIGIGKLNNPAKRRV